MQEVFSQYFLGKSGNRTGRSSGRSREMSLWREIVPGAGDRESGAKKVGTGAETFRAQGACGPGLR